MAMPVSPRRPDFTGGLIHMTKPRKPVEQWGKPAPNAEETVPAFDVLKKVLTDGKIVGGTTYVKGGKPVVCFSEIPLSSLQYYVDRDGQKSRLTSYAIAISKASGFEAGARPVIYLPDKESDWIPKDQIWRLVQFQDGTVDFTHEREWRMLGDFDLTKSERGIYVVVWTPEEAEEIAALKTPLGNRVIGVLVMEHLNRML